MDISDAVKIQKYIDSNYPGGANRFLQDGGSFCYLPEPANVFYIVHEDLPKDIKRYLDTVYNENIIYGTVLNKDFNNEEMMNIYRIIDEVLSKAISFKNRSIGLYTSPCVFCITIPTVEKDDEIIDVLIDKLSSVPGIRRGCVMSHNGAETFEGHGNDTDDEDSEDETPLLDKLNKIKDTDNVIPSKKIIGRPAREKVISQDDILNLKIAFATSQSLEEFLSRV